MLSIIISSFAGIIGMLVLDYIWLAKIAKSFYLEKLASHITVQDGGLVPYVPAIPLVYIVAIAAVWIFALPKAHSVGEAFLFGALLGFIMYAFYDFTNLATLKDYPWSLALVDIAWGTILVGTVAAITYFVHALMS